MSSRISLVAAATLALLGTACTREAEPRADLVLRGGAVVTMSPLQPRVEAIAIADGTILAVGTNEEVSTHIGEGTSVVELDGRMVLPGFHDAHVHPLSGGIELGQCDLNELTTEEEILRRVSECAAGREPGAWVVGGGWQLPIFPDANPKREALDAAAEGRPVFLSGADGHSAWVSSAALEIAGIDRETPDPPRGRIERDPRTGEPSGTLREAAMGLVQRHLPEITAEDRVDGLERGLALANRYGITSFVEAAAREEDLIAYWTLAERGELTARVVVSLWVDPERGPEQVDELVRLRERYRAPGLSPTAAKIFADGVIEAGTAALLEPYLGSDGEPTDRRGELELDPESMAAIVERLDAEGFQIHIHAIGDRAIRTGLDAIEAAIAANAPHDRRHHLAHIQLFDPADIPRFAELGVIANFQPLWAIADRYILELTEPVLGPERSRWLYPMKSVADSGALLVAGSDWSVSSMNPLDAIQVAITRRLPDAPEGEPWIPEELLDLDTILAAYTRNGAYLMGQEATAGTLEVGKAADLIVLDRDLFAIPPTEIHRARVLLTLLGGAEVYRDPEAPPSVGAAGR